MALGRAVDAIRPVQPGVEPLGRVRGAHLGRQRIAHFVKIGLRVGFGGEIAALPAPIRPGAGQTVEHLRRVGFAHEAAVLGQALQLGFVGDRAPQEFGHALFLDLFQGRGDARLAEILLRQHVGGNLAPGRGHGHVRQLEHHGAVRIADLRRGFAELNGRIGRGAFFGEPAFDLHVAVPETNWVSPRPGGSGVARPPGGRGIIILWFGPLGGGGLRPGDTTCGVPASALAQG